MGAKAHFLSTIGLVEGVVHRRVGVVCGCRWWRAEWGSWQPHRSSSSGDPHRVLLDQVREESRLVAEAEARRLERVVELCAVHQVPDEEAATVSVRGRETTMPLAGPGAPQVSEFAVVELAAALGMTVEACPRFVGQALETRHRLPRLWARVQAGELAWWRAARIAQHTMALPAAGAAHVDARLAAVAHKVGVVLTERLCEEALATFDPAEAERRRVAAAESRRARVHLDGAGPHGTVEVDAILETADALDLETALALAADQLKTTGSTQSLDVRRAMAMGLIARHYLTDSLNADPHDEAGRAGVRARRVTIDVRLHDPGTGRCQTTRSAVSVEQVKAWCSHPDTQVTIRPVRDQSAHLRVDAYEVPDRLAEQVDERDGTCVHPWCTRPAHRCDHDHCQPYDRGGPTSSDNIAPLCRRHHRAKTHAGWTYRFLRPGAYLWRSPTGLWFHRDHTGTTDLGRLGPD